MNKWVLIIGGSSGIGLASAKKLAEKGFKIIIIHRDRRSVLKAYQDEVDRLKARTEVYSFNIDATSKDKIEECIAELPALLGKEKVGVMIHSLSRGNLKPLISEKDAVLSQQDLSLTFESMGINILSWVNFLRNKNLLADDCRIIGLTSAGSYRYWQSYAAVGIAKAAIETLTKYLAVELGNTGIRVNTIEAGITDTPSLRVIPGYEDLILHANQRNPSGRMTQPSDIANAIYLLTLPEANWINGAIIKVDGGEHLV